MAEFVTRSLLAARKDLPKIYDNSGVVSILGPDVNDSKIMEYLDPEEYPHVVLRFHDISNPDAVTPGRRIVVPDESHVARIIDRSDDLLAEDLVYCHCHAGVSRSTAAAFILSCIQEGEGSEWECMQRIFQNNDKARPNRLMVKYADEQLGRGGDMVRARDQFADAVLGGWDVF